MIVGLVGEAVVIAEHIGPLIPRLFLSPDNTLQKFLHVFGNAFITAAGVPNST